MGCTAVMVVVVCMEWDALKTGCIIHVLSVRHMLLLLLPLLSLDAPCRSSLHVDTQVFWGPRLRLFLLEGRKKRDNDVKVKTKKSRLVLPCEEN